MAYSSARLTRPAAQRDLLYSRIGTRDNYAFNFPTQESALNNLLKLVNHGVRQHKESEYVIGAAGIASATVVLNGEKRKGAAPISMLLSQDGIYQRGTITSVPGIVTTSVDGADEEGTITVVQTVLGGEYGRKDPSFARLGSLLATATDANSDGLVTLFSRAWRGYMETRRGGAAVNNPVHPGPIAANAGSSANIMPRTAGQTIGVANANNPIYDPAAPQTGCPTMEGIVGGLSVTSENALNRMIITFRDLPSIEPARLRAAVCVLEQLTRQNLGFVANMRGDHSAYTKGVDRINPLLLIPVGGVWERMNEDGAMLPAGAIGKPAYFAYGANDALNSQSWLDAIGLLVFWLGGSDLCAVGLNDCVRQTALFFGPQVMHLSSAAKERMAPTHSGYTKVAYRRIARMYTSNMRTANVAGNAADANATQWPAHPQMGYRIDGDSGGANLARNLDVGLLQEAFGNNNGLQRVGVVARGFRYSAALGLRYAENRVNDATVSGTEDERLGRVLRNNDGVVDPTEDRTMVGGTDALNGLHELDNYFYRWFLNLDVSTYEKFEVLCSQMSTGQLCRMLKWVSELGDADEFHVRRGYAPPTNADLAYSIGAPVIAGVRAADDYYDNMCCLHPALVLPSTNCVEKLNSVSYAGLARANNFFHHTSVALSSAEDKSFASALLFARLGGV
jgi:hypothetical protein